MAVFNGLDWPVLAILLMVIVSIILMWFSPGAGALLLSLVLVAGIDWNLPLWFWVIFWIIWFLSLGALIWSFFDWRAGVWVARPGSLLTASVMVFLLLVALIPWGGFGAGSGREASGPSTTSATSPSSTGTGAPTPSPTATEICPATWEIKYLDNDENRWFKHGLASIQKAKTNADARVAAQDWLNAASTDPIRIKGAISYFLKKNVPVSTLQDGKCVSADAKSYVTEMGLAIATANISPGYAPADGTNSGVSNGQVVASHTPGIVGNRKAIKIVLSDGEVIWIMARCGNPVTRSTPRVPPGRTDQTPPPRHTPTPSTHTTTTPSKTTTTTKPPTCLSKYGPGYSGTYPNCHKDGSASVQPTQPSSAPGTNPPPVVVTKTGTPQPTSAQCYDPVTGDPVPSGSPGAWCS